MSRFNWEKASRNHRVTFTPSQRSQPATRKQLDYIVGLAYQKGQPKPKLPKTKKGASDLIERLLVMPDVDSEYIPLRAEQPEVELIPPNPRTELVTELRAHFPQLSPMTCNSMAQLFGQIDADGMAFVFDSLMHEDTPTDSNALVLFILRRFLAEFADITGDDPALVPG